MYVNTYTYVCLHIERVRHTPATKMSLLHKLLYQMEAPQQTFILLRSYSTVIYEATYLSSTERGWGRESGGT